MGKLIDVDDIGLTDFEIVMCDGDYKEALTMLCRKIENAPEAIVRCKDCFCNHDCNIQAAANPSKHFYCAYGYVYEGGKHGRNNTTT